MSVGRVQAADELAHHFGLEPCGRFARTLFEGETRRIKQFVVSGPCGDFGAQPLPAFDLSQHEGNIEVGASSQLQGELAHGRMAQGHT